MAKNESTHCSGELPTNSIFSHESVSVCFELSKTDATCIHNSSAILKLITTAPLPCLCLCLQVAADMDSSDGTGSKPALGLAWADTVTVRLVAHRPEAVESEEECQKVCNYVHR